MCPTRLRYCHLVEEPARLIRQHSFQVALVSTLACVALYRHNGLPVVVGWLVWLAWSIGPELRWVALKLGALALFVVFLWTFGIQRLLGVTPMPPFLRAQAPIHQVAAVLASGITPTSEDAALLGSIQPLERWRADYRCTSAIPSLAGVNEARFEAEQRRFLAAWWRLVRSAPGAVLRHQLCVTGLIWNPFAPYYPVSLEIVDNAVGLKTATKSRALSEIVTLVRGLTFGTDVRLLGRLLVWGPALHLTAVIVALGYVFYRRRATLPLLPLAPAVIHTAVLLVLIPSAEFRLQYPVFAYGLLAPVVAIALSDARPSRGRHEESGAKA